MKTLVFLAVAALSAGAFAEDGVSVTNAPEKGVVAEGQKAKTGRNADLERLFREADLNFDFVESENVYHLGFRLDGGRTQAVFVSANSSLAEGVGMIEIFSFAYDGFITKAQTVFLLHQNNLEIIGCWSLSPQFQVRRSCRVASDVMAQELAVIARSIALAADQLEKEWTDKDEF